MDLYCIRFYAHPKKTRPLVSCRLQSSFRHNIWGSVSMAPLKCFCFDCALYQLMQAVFVENYFKLQWTRKIGYTRSTTWLEHIMLILVTMQSIFDCSSSISKRATKDVCLWNIKKHKMPNANQLLWICDLHICSGFDLNSNAQNGNVGIVVHLHV